MVRWLIVLFVACDAGAPPKPPLKSDPVAPPIAKAQVASVPDAWAVPPTRHEHAVKTSALAKPDLGSIALPKHGMVVKSWGLGGDSTVILDTDAGTIRVVSNLAGKKPTDHRKTLQPDKLLRASTAGTFAWREEPAGPMPSATDVREDLYVIDDDEAFYLSGYPISDFAGAEKTGRPWAAKAVAAMYELGEGL